MIRKDTHSLLGAQNHSVLSFVKNRSKLTETILTLFRELKIAKPDGHDPSIRNMFERKHYWKSLFFNQIILYKPNTGSLGTSIKHLKGENLVFFHPEFYQI